VEERKTSTLFFCNQWYNGNLTGKRGRAVYRIAALKSSRASSGKLPCWGGGGLAWLQDLHTSLLLEVLLQKF